MAFDYDGMFGKPMDQLQRSQWATKTAIQRGAEEDFGQPVLIPGGRFFPVDVIPAAKDLGGNVINDGFTKADFLTWAIARGMEQGTDANLGDFVKWPDPPNPSTPAE